MVEATGNRGWANETGRERQRNPARKEKSWKEETKETGAEKAERRNEDIEGVRERERERENGRERKKEREREKV